MAESKKIGTIRCLVCGELFEYLTTSHMRKHPPGYPKTDPEYWTWVAENQARPGGSLGSLSLACGGRVGETVRR